MKKYEKCGTQGRHRAVRIAVKPPIIEATQWISKTLRCCLRRRKNQIMFLRDMSAHLMQQCTRLRNSAIYVRFTLFRARLRGITCSEVALVSSPSSDPAPASAEMSATATPLLGLVCTRRTNLQECVLIVSRRPRREGVFWNLCLV